MAARPCGAAARGGAVLYDTVPDGVAWRTASAPPTTENTRGAARLRPTAVRAFPNAAFDLVLLAASAGGVPALRELVPRLPPDFPAPLALVLHLSPAHPSRLPGLLRSWARLDAAFAAEGDRPRAGTVHVAPPDRHLVVRPDGRLGLLASAKVHFTRPAADLLFATAAARFGPRALAVVLTGPGRDGTAGALAIRAAGGVVMVQEPSTAAAPDMPGGVVASGAADLVLPLAGLASALTALVMVPGAVGLLGPPRRAAYRGGPPATRAPPPPPPPSAGRASRRAPGGG